MKKTEVESIKCILREQIMSMHGMVEESRGEFSKGNKRIWISTRKNKVWVHPIEYYYTSKVEAMQYEFELKDVIDNYLRYGFSYPRLSFEERDENEQKVLYCVIEAAGVTAEFRPRWGELLNGANQMVFTEFKNAKEREKDRMLDILNDLRKITKQAEEYCKELGYDV